MRKVSMCFIMALICNLSFAQLRVKPTGQVGIGTLNPNNALDVVGNGIYVRGALSTQSAPFIRGGTAYSIIPDYTWGGDMMTGIAHPNYGRIRFVSIGWELGGWNLYNTGVAFNVFGTADSWGWITLSDKRFKKNITPISSALDVLLKLKPCSYDLKTEEFKKYNPPSGLHYGFIAQEILTVLPEVVNENNEGYLSVDYTAIIPLLVAGLKEQQAEIENLKAALKRLEK